MAEIYAHCTSIGMNSNEPPHGHVDHGSASAKVWLHDFSVTKNIGYSAKALGKIQRMVREYHACLKEAWYAYFGIKKAK